MIDYLISDEENVEDLLEDGPVWFNAGDGWVIRVCVLGICACNLGPINLQTDGGFARA